ncbi:MAG: transglycosylase domain-containing protein, partial [Deltaproteobacteria bacterium]
MIRRLARRALAALLVVLACGLAVTCTIAGLVVRGGLVDPARLARPDDATRVVDRHDRALRQTRVDGVDRRWIALTDVPAVLVDAVIATEDASFRSHSGVDVPAVFRAVVTNLLPWRRRSGASTITEQLVKLTYGRRGPVLWAKTLEAARALALERTLTKDQILEQYLNRLPYGDGIEGVARASEAYFGCEPRALTLAQAALLAGIPQAPSANDPRRHPARARIRRDAVLARMLTVGVIDRAAYAAAVATPLEISPAIAHPYEAPRFVDRVLREVRDHRLAPRAGRLDTTLDADLQREAERLLTATLARFEARGAHNAAALVVANATGEVLAYVGAADAGDERGGALDLLASARAPGSTLKPFVYELWFERGGTAATVVDDLPSAMTGARGESFDAQDYDGRYRGPVRARVALSSSLNLAALDVARRVGPDAIVQRLRAAGITVPGRASDYGGAIVLGGLSVAPWDLAEAYVTLAREGVHVPLSLTPVARLRPERVMNAAAAALTRDVLTAFHQIENTYIA